MILAEHLYASSDFLAERLAWNTAKTLIDAIAERGEARLLVSGGSTPKKFFAALSQQSLAWERVTIGLVDDRCVESFDPNSNAKLVGENLLIGDAFAATFQPLFDPELGVEKSAEWANGSAEGADVVVLGLGGDGHTASLFPGSPQLEQGLSADAPAVLAAEPTMEPMVTRLTYSGPFLAKSPHVFLHFEGAGKREVYEEARSKDYPSLTPISWFLHHPECPVETYWAP
jgi:6-phosphogluconolactonase